MIIFIYVLIYNWHKPVLLLLTKHITSIKLLKLLQIVSINWTELMQCNAMQCNAMKCNEMKWKNQNIWIVALATNT